MAKTMHLLRENELVGSHDVIPGAARSSIEPKSPPNGRDSISPYQPSKHFATNINRLDRTETIYIVDLKINLNPSFERSFISSMDVNRVQESGTQ